ncbi:hypothetical protein C7P94_10660 [Staphylococcus aureus]|nr:hypothetical protein C7P94_10660 [Staphylococcus aureus]
MVRRPTSTTQCRSSAASDVYHRQTLYRKRTVIWPFYFYTIIRTLSYFISPIFKLLYLYYLLL